MNKKLQVFVSSTYTDLIEERQVAVQAILDAGHIPAGMELFKAGKSQMKTIHKWIDESDVYMLILGGRYGSIEPESSLSYTELEYKYALSKNMPIFSIILEDNFLFSKAASKGKDVIFEKDNIEKYNLFKECAQTRIAKFIDNTDKISSIIRSQLDEIMNDDDYHLIGWKKSNDISFDYTDMSETLLYQNNQKIIDSILKQKFPLADESSLSSFALTFSKELEANFNRFNYILNTSERQVHLDFTDSSKHTIRVTITKTFEYFYLNSKEHFFSINFNSTEQQAKTYNIHSLIIDNTDYTSQIEYSISKTKNRGQFMYNVKSNKIPISSTDSKVVFVASYECPPLDFFQSHRLSCLCKHFRTTIHLDENVRQQYTLLCSTFSPFSKMHYDDYKAGEILKPYDGQITLPNWSFPGSGYAATLKYKTAENHV